MRVPAHDPIRLTREEAWRLAEALDRVATADGNVEGPG